MNNKCAVIIQARMSSKRLPGKTLLPIGNDPLIFYVVNRLMLSGLPVIVATSSHPSDDELASYLQSKNYKHFRGDLENVLKRYIDTAVEFGVEEIVRVTADNPLVDLAALQDAIPYFEKYDYVDGIGKEGLIKGTGFELVKLSALRSIISNKSEQLEHVTLALREMIGQKSKYISLPVPKHQKFQKEIFLTCDYVEDLEVLRNLFSELNYSFDIPISKVLDLFKRKPHIFKLNQHLHTGI